MTDKNNRPGNGSQPTDSQVRLIFETVWARAIQKNPLLLSTLRPDCAFDNLQQMRRLAWGLSRLTTAVQLATRISGHRSSIGGTSTVISTFPLREHGGSGGKEAGSVPISEGGDLQR